MGENVQVSFIFMITYTQSSMQMGPDDHPHKIFKYVKCGDGVVFNLRFRRQSVYPDDTAKKKVGICWY